MMCDFLTEVEVNDLTNVLSTENYCSCTESVYSLEHLSQIRPLLVVSSEIKWFMNWSNSRPAGTCIDIGRQQKRHGRQVAAIKELRQMCYPDRTFKECYLYRNKLPEFQTLNSQDPGAVLFMWKKGERRKQVYTANLSSIVNTSKRVD